MIIKKLYAENFLSLGDGVEFDLENRGILFIKGVNKDAQEEEASNGAGKSSIIEGIVWALTGETIRGIERVDEVVNNKVGADCLCSLEIVGGYSIERYRKHSKHNNAIRFLKDGHSISKSATLTQKDINSTFNIDFDIISNSIILSNSSIRLNFLDSKNNILRRQIIETILGVDKFSDFLETSKKHVKELERGKDNALYRIEDSNRQIQTYNDKVAELKHRRENWDRQQKELKDVFDREKKEKIERIEIEISELKSVDVKYNLELHQKIKGGRELEAKINGAIQGIRRSIKELEGRKYIINDDIEKYNKFVNQPCKLCGTILDQEKIQTTIKNLESEKSGIDTKIVSFNTDIKQKQESIVLINDKLEQIAPAYNESVLYNIEFDIVNLKERVDEIQKSEFQPASFQDISFALDVEKLVQTIKVSEQEVEKATEELKYYSFWEEGFGKKGLVVYLLEQMIKFLNNKVEFYLNILSKGQIRLEFDKYLDFKISGLNYRNCSSGERKRVDLAVLLALYDLTNLRNKQSFNILILDEVLDSIDKAGVEAVKDLLLELNKRIPTILVISHNNYLAEYFPTTVTIVKENGISFIE